MSLTDDEIRELLALEAVASPGAAITDDELRRHPKHLWERQTMTALCGEVLRLRAENERLRDSIRQTHANYCDEAWTSRGLHAPECLLEDLGPNSEDDGA